MSSRSSRPPRRRRTSTRVRQNRALAALCSIAALGLVAVIASGNGWGSDVPTGTSVRTGSDAAAVASHAQTTPVPTTPTGGGVSLAAVGDTVMGTPEFGLPPAGGSTLFNAVKPLLKGDVVIGNLESALATGTSTKCAGRSAGSCFAFASPPEYVRNLKKAGFTVMNLANNHSNDWGPSGLRSTIRALESVGILHTGRPGEIAVQRTADGTKVAFVGVSPYPWSQDAMDIPGAQRLVRKAAALAPIVVANMHVGAEGAAYRHVPEGSESYLAEPRGWTRGLARGMVDAGADLVVGHGPHVMRGMEFRRGRLIAYSLGNFMGYRVFNTRSYNGLSGVLQVKMAADGRFLSGRLVPTRLSSDGVPSPGGASISDVAALSRADFGRAAARLSASGSITAP